VTHLSASRRRALLDEYIVTVADIAEAERADDVDRLTELVDRQASLIFEYQDGFPLRPVARCPFTGALARLAIDAFDLDGLWWNWGAPLRGDNDLPPTTFAYNGAMRIGTPVARASFVARPGPEVPFVVPRVLDHPDMRAVVSTLPVGPHTGYPVVYFADPVPADLRRVNHWGASLYFARTSEGFGEHYAPEGVAEYDWDLAPWIESGKLSWIAGGDEALKLRSSIDGCPYVGLDGHREISLVVDGEVHWSDS
jgi:hypothetical protein